MEFPGSIRFERELYDAPGETWLEALRKLPATTGCVLLVAHSPGVGEAAALLCGASPRAFDVPTAGVIAVEHPASRFREIEEGAGALRWFLRPKLVEKL
jgi:phosphohistidine phosphatase SixA